MYNLPRARFGSLGRRASTSTREETATTSRRDLLAASVRIVTILATVCVVGLGGARDGGAVPLESWDDQINNPTRFKVLPEFNNEAVLDRETQLVWRRDLGIIYGSTVLRTSWETSNVACLDSNIGGRKGLAPAERRGAGEPHRSNAGRPHVTALADWSGVMRIPA